MQSRRCLYVMRSYMTEDNKFKKIKKDDRNIAVALGFEKEISDVPIVLASGRGKLAEQIV